MPIVNVKIRDTFYQIACDPGQESHLLSMAEKVNSRIQKLSGPGTRANDALLLILTAITMEDEIAELQKSREWEKERESALAESSTVNADLAIAASIDAIAEYIENLAIKLERS